MRKRCSIQQGEKKITVDRSKVLKNRLYRLFRFFGGHPVYNRDISFVIIIPSNVRAPCRCQEVQCLRSYGNFKRSYENRIPEMLLLTL